jgi:hypothetical protein
VKSISVGICGDAGAAGRARSLRGLPARTSRAMRNRDARLATLRGEKTVLGSRARRLDA